MVANQILTNQMEEMLSEFLDGLMRAKTLPGCTCPRCLVAIKVEALNRLPTFYVTSKLGEVYGEYRMKQQQYSADIAVAVSQAIEIVAAKGHHAP